MFTRIRIAAGVAFAALLLTNLTAFAKGSFDFITIAGSNLKDSVRLTDSALTEDFFTFANFHEDRTKTPADPGQGYEITRHYVQGNSDVVFDRLHYYPESGFVFYDGIENGDSEYDGGWYIANPDIKPLFETALAIQLGAASPVEKKQSVSSASELEPASAIAQAKPAASNLSLLLIIGTALTVGLAALFALTYRRRKPASPSSGG